MEPVFEEAERWNLSQQGTASIINLINVASGKITKNDQSFVMTPDHVHKLQKKMRIEKVKERMGKSPIAIGVDERKDKTKVRTGDCQRGSKRYQVVKEDHATVIFWPEETYEGHVVPSGGSAKALAKSFMGFLLERTDFDWLS